MPPTLREIQAKAAQDEDLRAALLRDPLATLTAMGLEVPAGVMVTVVEASPEHVMLVIPPKLPDDGDDQEPAGR